MLPKPQRLTKHMIEHLFKNARRVKTSRFLVSYSLLPELKNPCISMVAPKKQAKTAVVRNTLRRKGYAAAAPLMGYIKPGMGILVTFSTGNTDFTPLEMSAELNDAFKKAGLYI